MISSPSNSTSAPKKLNKTTARCSTFPPSLPTFLPHSKHLVNSRYFSRAHDDDDDGSLSGRRDEDSRLNLSMHTHSTLLFLLVLFVTAVRASDSDLNTSTSAADDPLSGLIEISAPSDFDSVGDSKIFATRVLLKVTKTTPPVFHPWYLPSVER